MRRDIFDESHFLSSDCSNGPIQTPTCLTDGVTLEAFAPPFLIKGKVLGDVLGFSAVETQSDRKEIEMYIAQEGDTLSLLAGKFNISVDTIALANDLSAKSTLKPGQKLVVLPVSGILHMVANGDNVSSIAQLYKVKAQDVIEFNGLSDENKIAMGDMLVIPGGKKPKVAPSYNRVPLSNSYFIFPLPQPCRLSQGLHWFNAVDFSNDSCGDPVFAAAGGTVQRVGFFNDSGNYVRVLHPNGVVTFYGHLSKIAAVAGQKVSQGQIIGYVGHTGYTIPAGEAGCHLHFDVRFAENPFAK